MSTFLDIDPLRLDKEWLEQPKLYHEYAEKLANARQEHDNAVNALKVIEAEVDRELRRDKKKAFTEAAIRQGIVIDSEYQEGLERVSKAKHKVDLMQAAVTALDHRKRALTMLVELFVQDYFSDPKIQSSSAAKAGLDRAVMKTAVARTVGKFKRSDKKEED